MSELAQEALEARQNGCMSGDRTKTPIHLALERFSTEAAGLNAMQLRGHPGLLVALAGEHMADPSEEQEALISQVLDVIKKALVESFDDAEQVVLKIGLGIEPLNRRGISWRIGEHQRSDRTFHRGHGYYGSRDRVFARLAVILESLVVPESAPAMDESDRDYPKWVVEAADQLVLHLQELGCYTVAYLHLSDELIRASNDDRDRYQIWQRILAGPDEPVRMSLYEYVAVADIMSDLQGRPPGRALLRDIGLGKLVFAPMNTSDVVEWSPIGIELGGFESKRDAFFRFLDKDKDGHDELDRWHRELTGNTATLDQPEWIQDGMGLLHFLAVSVTELLNALFTVVPEAFAEVRDITERAESLIRLVCRRSGHLGPRIDGAESPEVEGLGEFEIEQLWDALTLYRQVQYKPEYRKALPPYPNRGHQLLDADLSESWPSE